MGNKFQICYGVDETGKRTKKFIFQSQLFNVWLLPGNILKNENIKMFSKKVMRETNGKGVMLVSGDGVKNTRYYICIHFEFEFDI